jgi:hypothetical protein
MFQLAAKVTLSARTLRHALPKSAKTLVRFKNAAPMQSVGLEITLVPASVCKITKAIPTGDVSYMSVW